MKYLCLVYFEQKIWDEFSEEEAEAVREASAAYDNELRRSGHFVQAQALQSVDTAATVRMRNGKISHTDGPFAETKEVLGGFLLIEARDLNEAIQVAGRIPLARYGSVEIRPIMTP